MNPIAPCARELEAEPFSSANGLHPHLVVCQLGKGAARTGGAAAPL